ncbi:MAG: hypothetical protein V2A53_03415, partial [bacterium]
MSLTATEQDILKVVAESKRATVFQVNRQTGLSLGYLEYLCKYLVRGGYLKSVGQGRYSLAPEGKKVLVSLGYGLGLDAGLIKELASQVAKEVAKEIKIKGGIRISPEEEERKKIQIKTDYTLPAEDKSIGLESNIERIGAKIEKEKSDIEKKVRLLKKIKM